MKLSIVVLNYKSKNLVKYFLKNVLNFNFPWQWEVIVVDNASNDDIQTITFGETFPNTIDQNSEIVFNASIESGGNFFINDQRGHETQNISLSIEQKSMNCRINEKIKYFL